MSRIYAVLELEQQGRAERPKSMVTEPPRDTLAPSGPLPLVLEEEMVVLSHTIDSLLPHTSSKVIQFICSQQGEGTTTLIRAFAITATVKLNKSVLLLDPDLRQTPSNDSSNHPSYDLDLLTKHNTPMGKGPRDVREPDFFVCPVSINGTSLSTVFSSPHMSDFLDELRQRFDLILVDSPAAATSPAGLSIARQMDGVVLIVEAENAHWPVINATKDSLMRSGGNVLGMIFNKQQQYIPSFIDKRL